MTRYYKSRDPMNPVLYVEEDGLWRSYAPDGETRQSAGRLPVSIFAQVDEVDPDQARAMIRARAEEARRRPEEFPGVGRSGLGGWLVFPIIGLLLTPLLSALVLSMGIIPEFGTATWSLLTRPGTDIYHPAWGPFVVFVAICNMAMFVAPIILLVLMFQRRRILLKSIIWFYVLALLATIISFVAIAFLSSDAYLAAGFPSISGGVQASFWLFTGSVVGAAVWIPYFRFSKRARNTFVRV